MLNNFSYYQSIIGSYFFVFVLALAVSACDGKSTDENSKFAFSKEEIEMFVESRFLSFSDGGGEENFTFVSHPPFHISVVTEFDMLDLVAEEIGERAHLPNDRPIIISHPNDHLLKNDPTYEELRDMYVVFASGKDRDVALDVGDFDPDPEYLSDTRLGCRSRIIRKSESSKLVTYVIIDRTRLSGDGLRNCFMSNILSLAGLRKSENIGTPSDPLFRYSDPEDIDFFAISVIARREIYGKITLSQLKKILIEDLY